MTSAVGRNVIRSDADAKVRGEAVYGVDFTIPGTLYAALARSAEPAGEIRAVDTSAAEAMPGVRGVFTAEHAPDVRSGLALDDQPLFASSYVSYEGEPIAAVVAETLEQARSAAAAIRVDIDPLEPVVTVEDAVADGARLVHEDWASFTPIPGMPDWPRAGNVCGEMVADPGGVDDAFEQADIIVEDVFRADRQYQAYMEPKNATAVYGGGRYTIHVAHQYPFAVRDRTARALGVRPSEIRVIGHEIGGGFGAKLDVGLEPYAALLARLTRAPVKMVNDRVEDLLTCNSRDAGVVRIRSGLTKDGRIVARDFRVDTDSGAYVGDTAFLLSVPLYVAASLYRVDGPTRVVARAIYTNTVPTGAFRGVNGTYLYFALERHTDNLANAIGMDRREFRLKNLMTTGHVLLNGQELEDADILQTAFDKMEEVAPWAELGKGPNRGVGIASCVWLTNPLAGHATLVLNSDGSLSLITGATENGSGAVALGLRQIAAEELGLSADEVTVSMPDTDVQGWDGGSQGSRTTHVAGRAIREAGAAVRERVLQTAARLLEVSPEDVELAEGGVRVIGSPDRSLTMAEVAGAAQAERGPIAGTGSYATAAPKFDPEAATGMLFPIWPTNTYHVHVAEVEVDPDTGAVTVLRYIVVQDVGAAISPAGVIGQIQGGVAQGIGYALYEGLAVGADGRYLQRTLESYRLPIALDVPRVEVALLEPGSEEGPYGAKGAAEPPVVPVAAAIGNAIADATGGPVNRIPITPEDVLDALETD